MKTQAWPQKVLQLVSLETHSNFSLFIHNSTLPQLTHHYYTFTYIMVMTVIIRSLLIILLLLAGVVEFLVFKQQHGH